MKKAILILGIVLFAALVALRLAFGPLGAAEASPTMHNCPQEGQWAIAVWTGEKTDAGEALGTCGKIKVAYALTPTGAWERYIEGVPEVNTLDIIDKYQGVFALGGPAAPVVPEPVETSGTLPVDCTINDLRLSVLSVGEGTHLGHTGLHTVPITDIDGTTATKVQSQMTAAVEFCLYCGGGFIQCVPAPDVSGDGHIYTYSVEVVGDQYDITYPVGHEYIRFYCGMRDGQPFYCRISSSQDIPFNPTCPPGHWARPADETLDVYCPGYPDAQWGAYECGPGQEPLPGEQYCFWDR